MPGRRGIGGRSRRLPGPVGALIDAGLLPYPRPRSWQDLLNGLTVCDEVTLTVAEPQSWPSTRETDDDPPA